MSIYLRTPKGVLEHELKPICAICNKEVDKIECLQDFRLNQFIITVECHGQMEMMRMDKNFTLDNKIERGMAFYSHLLESKDMPIKMLD